MAESGYVATVFVRAGFGKKTVFRPEISGTALYLFCAEWDTKPDSVLTHSSYPMAATGHKPCFKSNVAVQQAVSTSCISGYLSAIARAIITNVRHSARARVRVKVMAHLHYGRPESYCSNSYKKQSPVLTFSRTS